MGDNRNLVVLNSTTAIDLSSRTTTMRSLTEIRRNGTSEEKAIALLILEALKPHFTEGFPVYVILVLDYTGSMDNDIRSVKSVLTSMIHAAANDDEQWPADLRIAVVLFNDMDCYQRSERHPIRVIDFTTADVAIAILQGVMVDGGGGNQGENSQQGLAVALGITVNKRYFENQKPVSISPAQNAIVFVITDEPPGKDAPQGQGFKNETLIAAMSEKIQAGWTFHFVVEGDGGGQNPWKRWSPYAKVAKMYNILTLRSGDLDGLIDPGATGITGSGTVVPDAVRATVQTAVTELTERAQQLLLTGDVASPDTIIAL